MDIRTIILKHLTTVVENFSPIAFPEHVADNMLLDEFWLDSVAFTSLLTGIEAEVGFIPKDILTGTYFPDTIGEFIALYQKEL